MARITVMIQLQERFTYIHVCLFLFKIHTSEPEIIFKAFPKILFLQF